MDQKNSVFGHFIRCECQGNCGKKIDQKDTMLIKSYGTSRWTDKKTGKEMSKHGPMYIHFNEHCLKKIDNK